MARLSGTQQILKGNMADYFTNFSVALPLKPEQRQYAVQIAEQALAHRNEDAPLGQARRQHLQGQGAQSRRRTQSRVRGTLFLIHSGKTQ